MDVPNMEFMGAALEVLRVGLLGATPSATEVHLVKAPFSPTPTLDVSTLTEADFTGYAPIAIAAWGAPHLDSVGNFLIISQTPLVWTATDAVSPNTIYGGYVIDSDTDTVMAFTLPATPMLSGGAQMAIITGVGFTPWSFTSFKLP